MTAAALSPRRIRGTPSLALAVGRQATLRMTSLDRQSHPLEGCVGRLGDEPSGAEPEQARELECEATALLEAGPVVVVEARQPEPPAVPGEHRYQRLDVARLPGGRRHEVLAS